jgi:hypothetical protein
MKLMTHLHLVPRLRIHGGDISATYQVLLTWCLIKHRDSFIDKYVVAKLLKMSRDLSHIFILGGGGRHAVG